MEILVRWGVILVVGCCFVALCELTGIFFEKRRERRGR